MPEKKKTERGKKRERKLIPKGRAYIQATFNNTIISIVDPQGNLVCWSSAGTAGFKGSRKGTPYAAQRAAEVVAKKAMELGMRQAEVYVKGAGSGREASIRTLRAVGLNITTIRDVTPIPHNGCRPPKERKI